MKIIKRVDLVKQWKKERSKIITSLIKTFESGEYIGSKEIPEFGEKIAKYLGQNMQFVQIQEQTL